MVVGMGIVALAILSILGQNILTALVYLTIITSAILYDKKYLKEKKYERERLILYKASYYAFFITLAYLGTVFILLNKKNIVYWHAMTIGLLTFGLLCLYYNKKGIEL